MKQSFIMRVKINEKRLQLRLILAVPPIPSALSNSLFGVLIGLGVNSGGKLSNMSPTPILHRAIPIGK